MSDLSINDILAELTIRFDMSAITAMSADERKTHLIDMYNRSEGNLNESDGYNCPECKNKGYIAKLDANGYEVHVDCKCRVVRKTLARIKRSGLGDMLADCTFEKYNAVDAWQIHCKEKAQAFCSDDESKWFFIGGQVGCGKTHLCTAIASYYINNGAEVRYMLWAEDAKRLKALVNDITYQEKIDVYKSVDVLYIDDFLKTKQGESPTTADINLAFEILNHRLLDREKITIISSEKLLDEIIDYDEATMSRIKQKARRYTLNIKRDRSRNYRLRDSGVI